MLALANEVLIVSKPRDVIKDPYVLEFLDLPESERLIESQVETVLLNKLQVFLLELWNGLILCTEKNEQIFASRYIIYLPI